MKRNAIMWGLISLIIGLTAFWSCDDNDDDDILYRSFAMVQMDGDSPTTFTLKTERGNILTPHNPSSFISSLTNGEWVIATFYIKNGSAPNYTVELLATQQVLTKSYWVMTTSNVDSTVVATRDPGAIRNAWLVRGATSSYINVMFTTNWFSGPTYVNLVQNNTTVSGNDTIASTTPNPNAGVWTLDFITTYTGAQILPPQISRGIVSFILPTSSLEGLTMIKINYTNFKRELIPYTINLSSAPSSFSSEMPADRFDAPDMKDLE